MGAFKEFVGQKCTIKNTGGHVDDESIHMLRNVGVTGLSKERNGLCTGANGGYQALGLAVAAGAARVLLLGYDMRKVDGRSNWHAGHATPTHEAWYDVYRKPFDSIKRIPGVEVFNCTPGSALKTYPFADIATLLP